MSEFDDFSSEHSQRSANSKRLAEDTRPEWAVLKQEASRFAIDGKEFDGNKFEWAPYPSYYPDFLKLGYVSATFISREANGVLSFQIRLTRRPLEPGKLWADEESPLNTIEWSLKTAIEEDEIVWDVRGLDQKFSSAALAEKIAVELSKYHLAYRKHYENWSAA